MSDTTADADDPVEPEPKIAPDDAAAGEPDRPGGARSVKLFELWAGRSPLEGILDQHSKNIAAIANVATAAETHRRQWAEISRAAADSYTDAFAQLRRAAMPPLYPANVFPDLTNMVANMVFPSDVIAAVLPDTRNLVANLIWPVLDRQWADVSSAFRGLDGVLPKLDFGGLFGCFPPNWPDDVGLQVIIDELGGLARDSGIPVVWVPRAEILEQLRTAEEDTRLPLLLDRRGDVLQDCRTVVAEALEGPLAEQADLAAEALDSLSDGRYGSAQALAMNVVETLLRQLVPAAPGDWFTAKGAVKRIKRTFEEDYVIGVMRQTLALWPLVSAYRDYKAGRDGVPTGLSRHATVHAACFDQYTPANALLAVMLAASLVREAHERHCVATRKQSA